MLQLPSKRRKVSEHISVVVDNQNKSPNQTRPTTPTRASYQSPTKASLSRSHPHLVSPSRKKSATEPRGKLLRNELLGARSKEPRTGLRDAITDAVNNLNGGRTVEVGESAVREDPAEWQEPDEVFREPLRVRQPSSREFTYGKDQNKTAEEGVILPRLVPRKGASIVSTFREDSDEPDLPPTPVQLGLDPAPPRPRGLGSSSSPRGSKSGSGRHRIRVRGGVAHTTSPLKPKAGPALIQETEESDTEGLQNPEALESEAQMDPANVVPEELKQKQTAVQRLREEAQKLQIDIARLTNVFQGSGSTHELLNENNVLDLVRQGPGISDSISDMYHSTALGDQTPFYLNFFAPGNLQLSVRTLTRMVDRKPKLIHIYTVTAPPPWPPHAFSAAFEVVTDPETVTVEKITQRIMGKARRKSSGFTGELQDWIDERLISNLHRFDIGGIIWGMGMYFDECVRRAKVLQALQKKYNGSEDSSIDTEQKGSSDQITEATALSLCNLLSTMQTDFDLAEHSDDQEQAAALTRRGEQTSPKLLVTWDIALTWTGTVKSTQQVVPSGIPHQAQKSVQELFDRLNRATGIEKAFDAVWDLVRESCEVENDEDVESQGEDVAVQLHRQTEESGTVEKVQKPRKKPKKRKRIT